MKQDQTYRENCKQLGQVIKWDFLFSEPKERAMEPGKGSGSLTTSRQDITSHENASHDDVQRSCQQLIDDINAKRKRDTDLVNGT